MMILGIGPSAYVIGNNILIVAVGPSPGSTPISVPINAPNRQYAKFVNDPATDKPNNKLSIMILSSLISV